MARVIDKLLIALFAFASFIALYYEPAFFFQCGWEGLTAGATGPCAQSWVGRAWLGYLQVEPLYAHAPLFVQLINEFDTFLFGWFYALSLIVFLSGRQDRDWYRFVGTFVSGMMIYAMAFYLSWEALSYHETGAQLQAVFTYNGLWLLIFLLLLARLHLFRRAPEPSGVRVYAG
jgi:hypothetical protein